MAATNIIQETSGSFCHFHLLPLWYFLVCNGQLKYLHIYPLDSELLSVSVSLLCMSWGSCACVHGVQCSLALLLVFQDRSLFLNMELTYQLG